MITIQQDHIGHLAATIQEGDTVSLLVNNLVVLIKHNDVGVSIDYYAADKADAEPFREETVWWDDAD